jgi:indolepyruvate ferredoxin oxidoreductase
MVVNPHLAFPEVPVFAKAIDGNTRAAENVYADAQRVAQRLLDDHMATNLFLTGIAFQKGLIPVPAGNVEYAIRLNGVAVEMNLAAFRWGRLTIVRPDLVEQELARVTPTAAASPADPTIAELVSWSTGELRARLERLAADLAAYQDVPYARKFVTFVRRVAEAESRVGPARELTESVAVGLHKLMAYKDEYEVARLHLLDAARAALDEEFGEGAKVYWHLHPPMLRGLGYNRKIVLGPWFTPVFRSLRGMRRLRGTRADVFGYSRVRRTERMLISEYRSTIEAAIAKLGVHNLGVAVQLAELPDVVRGYEEIKMSNIDEYERQRADLLERMSSTDVGGGRPVVPA